MSAYFEKKYRKYSNTYIYKYKYLESLRFSRMTRCVTRLYFVAVLCYALLPFGHTCKNVQAGERMEVN